jgi:hypothetical protein
MLVNPPDLHQRTPAFGLTGKKHFVYSLSDVANISRRTHGDSFTKRYFKVIASGFVRGNSSGDRIA